MSELWGALPIEHCHRLQTTFIHLLWQGGVVGLVAAVVARVLKDAAASSRYALHTACLVSLPLFAIGTFSLTSSSESSLLEREHAVEVNPMPGVHREWATLEIDSVARDWSPVVVGLYLVVACLLAVRLAASLVCSYRLRLTSTLLEGIDLLQAVARSSSQVGLKMVPVVRVSNRVAVPIVVGIIRPMVLMPGAMLAGMSVDQFAAILCHEFAHIRRWDPFFNLVQRLVEVALFFHPVVWYLSCQMSSERETCCDDMAVASGLRPAEYADALLHVAEVCSARAVSRIHAVAAIGDGQTQLEIRINKVLGESTDGPTLKPLGVAAMSCSLSIVITLLGVAFNQAQSTTLELSSAPTDSAVQGGENRTADVSSTQSPLKPLREAEIEAILEARVDIDVRTRLATELIEGLGRKWAVPIVFNDAQQKPEVAQSQVRFTLQARGLKRRTVLTLVLQKLDCDFAIEEGQIKIFSLKAVAGVLKLDDSVNSEMVTFVCSSPDGANQVESGIDESRVAVCLANALCNLRVENTSISNKVTAKTTVVGNSVILECRHPCWHRAGDYEDTEAVALNRAFRTAYGDVVQKLEHDSPQIRDSVHPVGERVHFTGDVLCYLGHPLPIHPDLAVVQ